jgi:hypothetical protein
VPFSVHVWGNDSDSVISIVTFIDVISSSHCVTSLLNVFSKTQPKPYVNSISCGWPQLFWLCPNKKHPTSCRRTDVFYRS